MKKNLFLGLVALLLCGCSSKTEPLKRWYEYEDWWNYCSNGVKESEATIDDIGKIVTLKVNNQLHKVRLIDIDCDRSSENDATIHATFEFANVISDSKGYSLGTLWNNTNSTSTANFSYLNSSIRRMLVSNNTSDCLWGEKEKTVWSKTYKNNVVIDMLPASLISVLKKPVKYVYCKKEGSNEWINYEFHDQLFLLSPSEMGYIGTNQESANTTAPYAYYRDHTELTDPIRVKNQVNENELVSYDDATVIPSGSGHKYDGSVHNGAGCNEFKREIGTTYWLRSSCQDTNGAAWTIFNGGTLMEGTFVYDQAICVAPAFCI